MLQSQAKRLPATSLFGLDWALCFSTRCLLHIWKQTDDLLQRLRQAFQALILRGTSVVAPREGRISHIKSNLCTISVGGPSDKRFFMLQDNCSLSSLCLYSLPPECWCCAQNLKPRGLFALSNRNWSNYPRNVICLASIDEFRCLCGNVQVPDAVIGHAHATGAKLGSLPHVRSRCYNASLSPMTSKSSKHLSASSLISSIIPCQLVSTSNRSVNLIQYIGHNWLSIHPFHISERHLGALVLSKFKFWIIHVGNLVETDYSFSFSDRNIGQGLLITTHFCPGQPF